MTENNNSEQQPEQHPEFMEASEQTAMDHAVVSEMEFDLLTPRLHRKEAQHKILCPEHGLMPALLPGLVEVMQASAGRSGMVLTEKIDALNAMKAALEGPVTETFNSFIQDAIKHLDAAVTGYETEAAGA